jgi:hypothetical protein
MRGCPTELISPTKSPEPCVDGGVLEPWVLMVHHTSPGISETDSLPIARDSHSGD